MKSGFGNQFDDNAERYDSWFDNPRGKPIFDAELGCVSKFVTKEHSPWLEIGVGTGRFAQALGIEYGVDPSQPMLDIATNRGITLKQGVGEDLPFEDGFFGGVLAVVSICFVKDPQCVFFEAARVLKERGTLVVGIIPSGSAWGQMYAAKAEKGHHIYSGAKFYSVSQVSNMARAAGFLPAGAASTLVMSPDEDLSHPMVYPGTLPAAGFVAMAFTLKKNTAP